jgi:hypothetical protein
MGAQREKTSSHDHITLFKSITMFCGILSVPQNIVMDLKNVMHVVLKSQIIYLHANYIDFVGSKYLASKCLYVCRCSVLSMAIIHGFLVNSSIMNVGGRGNYHMQANMSSIQPINLAPYKFCG